MNAVKFGAVFGPYTHESMLGENNPAKAEKSGKEQQLKSTGEKVEQFVIPTENPYVLDHYLLTGDDIKTGREVKTLRTLANTIKPGSEKKFLPTQVLEKVQTLISDLLQKADTKQAALVEKAEK